MKSSRLRDILKDVLIHPPKKLNPSLISDIYSKCTTPEHLDDILSSSFFHTTAWRFFHADVTNSHLELILQVAAYEYETLSRKTCLELIQNDAEKTNDLILRILKSTMTYRKQDTRLQAAIFLFLRVLLMASPSVLIKHVVFAKWKILAFSSYIETLQKNLADNADSLMLLHCFLSFCVACILLSLHECKETVVDLCIPFRFLLESFDFKTRRLASIILLLNPQDAATFTSFQVGIEKLGFQGIFPLAEFAALRFDVSMEDFTEELQALSITDLARLAKHLGCYQSKLSKDVLVIVIVHLVLKSGISYHRLQKYLVFNETDILDLFDAPSPLPFIPSPTIPSFVPFSKYWVDQIEVRNAYKYLTLVNQRVESVLERLTITDPSVERGIKGTSKYFSEIQSIEVIGSKAKILIKNRRLISTINSGDTVLLVEFQKPSRNGGVNRLVKHGVNACLITKVISSSDVLYIEWNLTGFEERFNALICLPAPLGTKKLSCDEYSASDTLLDLWSNDSKKSTLKLSINCISELVLQSLGADPINKKRKLNDDQPEKADPHYKLNEFEIIVLKPKSTHNLPEDLASVLLAMFRRKSIIYGSNGVEKNRLMNAFLSTLSLSQGRETCLIVLPTKMAVDLFEAGDAALKIFKYDSNDLFLLLEIEKISKNLEKVSQISQHLGLEEYDFGSSIRNGLMLYHSHIDPTWRKFLKLLSKDNISTYPFTLIKNKTFDQGLEEIVDHFSAIRSLFAELEHFLPLDKFNFKNLKQSDYAQIRDFFAKRCQFLIASIGDLQLVERTFNNVIIHDVSSIPFVKGGFNRLIFIGDSIIDWGENCQISSSESRQEIARLYARNGIDLKPSYNPGFRFCVQHIKVPSSQNGLNVEEAKYCVALYQYMRVMRYPFSKLLIGVKSEHMKFLIEEILLEEKINKLDAPCDVPGSFSFGWPIIQNLNNVSPCDYLIVSCHGNPSWREYQNVAEASRMGIYLVGCESDHQYKIKSGDLEIIKNELYGSGRTSQKYSIMANVDQLRVYVDELIKHEPKI